MPTAPLKLFPLSLLATAVVWGISLQVVGAEAALVASGEASTILDVEEVCHQGSNDSDCPATPASEQRHSGTSVDSNDHDGVEEEEDGDEAEEEEEEEDGPGERFGVLQSLEHPAVDSSLLLQTLESTEEYLETFAETVDRFVYVRGECSNQHELCTLWATQGRCQAEQDFMYKSCVAACQACTGPVGPGSEWGVAQELAYMDDDRSHNTRLQRKLNETELYVKETVWKDEFYSKVVNLCFDKESHCTIWAESGECDANPEFMNKNCPASCETCNQLHYETRCPVNLELLPNIWQPGDLNAMFESIVADDAYETVVLSCPDYLEGDDEETAEYEIGPWIIAIDNFITDEEASHLIHWAKDMGYERSEEVGGFDKETGEAKESLVSEDRTSTNAWCSGDCDYDDKVVAIFDRIQSMTGVPPDHSEHLQLLKYEPDEFYLTHSDYIPKSHLEMAGPRILTVFMYLSDVEEGGETRFDWFDGEDGNGLFVEPKLGRVVIWPNVQNDNPSLKEYRTFHEAMPVVKGQKYAANAWLHLRDISQASEMGC